MLGANPIPWVAICLLYLLLGCAAEVPVAPQPCLCLFDIDRTLTGKQGSAKKCPLNREYKNITDPAYDGGHLILSMGALKLHTTFCRYCYTGLVSAGKETASRVKMHEKLLKFINFNKSAHLMTKDRWSDWDQKQHTGNVSSLLVAGGPSSEKHFITARVLDYLKRIKVPVPSNHAFYFDDKKDNVKGFEGHPELARQISCASRDPKAPDLGLCGATPEEINMALGQSGAQYCGHSSTSHAKKQTTTVRPVTTSRDVGSTFVI